MKWWGYGQNITRSERAHFVSQTRTAGTTGINKAQESTANELWTGHSSHRSIYINLRQCKPCSACRKNITLQNTVCQPVLPAEIQKPNLTLPPPPWKKEHLPGRMRLKEAICLCVQAADDHKLKTGAEQHQDAGYRLQHSPTSPQRQSK